MSEGPYVTLRCRFCGGVAHPASGCVYSPTCIVCGRCTRELWRWVKGATNRRGRRGGPSLYECVGVIRPKIVVG